MQPKICNHISMNDCCQGCRRFFCCHTSSNGPSKGPSHYYWKKRQPSKQSQDIRRWTMQCHPCLFYTQRAVYILPPGWKSPIGALSQISTPGHHGLVRIARGALKNRSGQPYSYRTMPMTLPIAYWTKPKRCIAYGHNAPFSAFNKKAGHFEVLLTNGVTHACNKLVLATGSNRQGHAFAEALGHAIVPPIPSLFTFKIADKAIHNLAGLSVKHVRIRLGINKKNQSTGPLLITHWGFSGPAIIKASAWQAQALHDCGYCFTMTIHWLANKPLSAIDTTLKKWYNQQHQRMNTQSPFSELPNRLWSTLLNRWDMAFPSWGH